MRYANLLLAIIEITLGIAILTADSALSLGTWIWIILGILALPFIITIIVGVVVIWKEERASKNK